MNPSKILFALVTAAIFSAVHSSSAAVFPKANNTTLLNSPSSWTPNSGTPGSTDIAQWDNTVTAVNIVGLGASAAWGGILITNVGGNVTITNDGNTLTLGTSGIDLSGAAKDLIFQCPVIFNNTETINVTNSRNLYFSNSITGGTVGFTKNGTGTVLLYASNNFSGPIQLNAGTLTLAASNAWPGAAGLTFNGGTLAINSGIIVTNLFVVPTNTTASANVSCSGILPNNITINAGPGSASPNVNATPLVTNGWLQVNLSGSVAAGGYITNNGTLLLNSGASPTLGTIVGSGNLGGIQDKATPVGGKILTFGNGSAFSYFQPFSNSISPTILQVAGNGAVSFKWFGYNDAAGIVYTNILNGGTWTFGSIGQNNSSCHYGGTCIISNGAAVTVTNNINYVHGTWNVVNNGSLTFNQTNQILSAAHNANNIGLNLAASANGALYVGGNGLNLAFGQTTPNTASENNSLTVGSTGLVYITNNFNVGVVGENKFAETDTVNLNGGKLLVGGTIAPAGGTLVQTNASPYAVIAPTTVFNWTGGQLSAAAITCSNGLNITVLTNANSALNTYNTNASYFTGSISSTAVTNSGGIMAPGDDGIPGRTIINNGGYVQTSGGTISMDLGGTTRASSFQASTNGFYDYLQVVGPIALDGTLKVKLVGGYVPAYTDQLNIIATSGPGNFISGTFTNLVAGGGGLGRVLVDGTTNTYFTVVLNSVTNTLYLINYTNISSSTLATYPTNINATVVNSGTALQVSWPATHLGWTLQAQTNSLGLGLGTNWADVPGTAAVISTNLPIDPNNGAVFYRLRN
jgi:autotransporter-associated beta strand protein